MTKRHRAQIGEDALRAALRSEGREFSARAVSTGGDITKGTPPMWRAADLVRHDRVVSPLHRSAPAGRKQNRLCRKWQRRPTIWWPRFSVLLEWESTTMQNPRTRTQSGADLRSSAQVRCLSVCPVDSPRRITKATLPSRRAAFLFFSPPRGPLGSP